MKGLFITGTDTEVGKTFVTALLTLGLRRLGTQALPLKPIASGGVLRDGKMVSEDALRYLDLGRLDADPARLTACCWTKPASPHFAAELEGREIAPRQVIHFVREWARSCEAVLVEGIGGWYVPITYEYRVSDFARALDLPVLVVSANRLGTINHTLLTLEAIRHAGLEPAGLVYTHPTPGGDEAIARNNLETVSRIDRTPVLGTVPYLPQAFRALDPDQQWNQIKDCFQWDRIQSIIHTR